MDFSAFASLIEMLFVYGIVLGLCLWQLISIRREIRKGREAQAAAEATAREGAGSG